MGSFDSPQCVEVCQSGCGVSSMKRLDIGDPAPAGNRVYNRRRRKPWMSMKNSYAKGARGARVCSATIVNAVGSIPSYATAKMLVREDGTIVGTVGGGASEAAVIEEAKEVLASGKPKMVAFDLHENPRMDIGMVCGGSLNVFIEAIQPAPRRLSLRGGPRRCAHRRGGANCAHRSRGDRRPAGIRQPGALPRCASNPYRRYRSDARRP